MQGIGNIAIFTAGKPDLVVAWYRWGHFLALVVTLFALFWIFYDSARKGRAATIWKVISVTATILVLPSLLLWLFPTLADPASPRTVYGAVDALAYIGLLGGIGALISLVGYTLGLGEPTRTCPSCGRRLDPSWEYCPYCAPAPAPVETTPEPTPVAPTEALEQEYAGRVPSKLEETRILEREEIEHLAYLVHISGPRRGKTYQLRERFNIGRDAEDNDLVIDDDAVSGHHARIKLEKDQFVLYDLASTNGTFVNDERIDKHALSDGDVIKMGGTAFSFMEVKEKEAK